MISEVQSLVDDLNASGDFDGEWYRQEYPDVALSGMSPGEHYILIGQQLGRRPRPQIAATLVPYGEAIGNQPGVLRPAFESFGIIRHNPLISILIVSYNSGNDLEVLLPSIAGQTYRNIEVVLIENGEEDTEPLLQRHISRYRFQRADNVGFAEGNNLALRLATGELVALINPDTRLEVTTIQNLLDALRFDAQAAAAVPKILFSERFIRVTFRSNAPFFITQDELLEGLAYRKLFVRVGKLVDNDLHSDSSGVLEVDLPYLGPRAIECTVTAADETDLHMISAQVGFSKQEPNSFAPSDQVSVKLAFNDCNCSSARFIINNAGSGIDPSDGPFDRGFGQLDDGDFFSKAYVQAICGCAALIRRAALIERELFSGPFFAYYEDSELSFWLRSQGYSILYQPLSVVYHKHSETTSENSLLWQVLVGRSRKLYDLATGAESLPTRYFNYNYPEIFEHRLRPKLEELDVKVRASHHMSELSLPHRPTACVYNSYFSSMGGGEKHAVDIASLLREKYEVYIASEEDFSIKDLEEYFSIDLEGVRKIISTNIDRHFSSKFDLFVNATYRSNLIPAARKNYYVVSFPHTDFDCVSFDGPMFLHNSCFTAGWAKEYWGEHLSTVVLPIIGQGGMFATPPSDNGKSRSIISVGRLTSEGHCKNHHLIIEAYRRLIDQSAELANWKLKIVGSFSASDEAAISYLNLLQSLAEGYNVEILTNAPNEVLTGVYQEASIYVHATGLGLPASMPEKHEHFGITPFEAMAQGCLPVVYAVGGPADQVMGLPESITFADFEQLVTALHAAMLRIESGEVRSEEIWNFARDTYLNNLEVAREIFLSEDLSEV